MKNSVIFYLLLCMYINCVYTCSSDEIRDLMVNSCNLINKKLQLHDENDLRVCCGDKDKIQMCVRYFCH